MRCVIRIDRRGIKLTPGEINSILNTVSYTDLGLEIDKYAVYKNIIKIYIYPANIAGETCDKIKEKLEQVFRTILVKKGGVK